MKCQDWDDWSSHSPATLPRSFLSTNNHLLIYSTISFTVRTFLRIYELTSMFTCTRLNIVKYPELAEMKIFQEEHIHWCFPNQFSYLLVTQEDHEIILGKLLCGEWKQKYLLCLNESSDQQSKHISREAFLNPENADTFADKNVDLSLFADISIDTSHADMLMGCFWTSNIDFCFMFHQNIGESCSKHPKLIRSSKRRSS